MEPDCGCGYELVEYGSVQRKRWFHEPDCPAGESAAHDRGPRDTTSSEVGSLPDTQEGRHGGHGETVVARIENVDAASIDYTCSACGERVSVGHAAAWPSQCPHCGTAPPTLIVRVGGRR